MAIALLVIADAALLCFIVTDLDLPILPSVLTIVAIAAGAGFVWVSVRKMGPVVSARLLAIAAGGFVLAVLVGAFIYAPDAIPLLIYALVLVGILRMAWSSATRAIRRRRMLLILGNVEKAVRMQMPIPRMIQAAAQGEKGAMRLRLLDLYDHLDRGEPLDQALIHAVPDIPCGVARSIAAGQRLGCLEHVLEAIIRRRSDDNNAYRPSPGIYWAYPVILIGIVSLVMVIVIPKYKGIFADFHVVLPPATRWLLEIANDFTQSGLGACVLLLLFLIFLGRALASLFPSLRTIAPFDGAVGDRIVWWTPVLGGLVRDRGMADLCDIVAAGVAAGHPLDETLRQAADAQPNAVMRRRAAAWAQAVSRGQSLHDAARYAHMPELFAAMLATVRSGDSLQQVLAFLWRHYEYRFSRTRAVLQAACVPAIVFFFGAFVALVGSALMQPIAMLSQHLSVQISGGF